MLLSGDKLVLLSNSKSGLETTFKITLIFHIASGFIALVAAPVAMMVHKGGNNHRLWGKIFFWCMTFVSASAFAMSVIHPNMFLFAISGFSFYMVASGYRWIYRKKIRSAKDVKNIDWILVVLAGIFNLFLLGYGLVYIINDPGFPFGYIASVFGIIGVLSVTDDIRQFYKSKEKNAWFFNHMGGMVGGYIATVSAFSAVNFNFLPTIIQWLWPTIIGVPLLISWVNFYKRKFKAGRKAEEVVEVRK